MLPSPVMTGVAWTAIGLLATTLLGSLFYLGSKIDALSGRLDSRFDGLTGRVDALGARLDSRIDGLESRLDTMASRIDAHLERHAG